MKRVAATDSITEWVLHIYNPKGGTDILAG
ncbi:hypothetical protein JOC55_005272 [Paenibacillus sacheonensis]|nr:hypothetical protein [Paenibacillus sacheonensis]